VVPSGVCMGRLSNTMINLRSAGVKGGAVKNPYDGEWGDWLWRKASRPALYTRDSNSWFRRSELHTCRAAIIGGSQFLGMFRKSRKATITSLCPSLRPSFRSYGKTRRPPDGFSWSLIFECFSKICPENSSFIQIWQEQRLLYTKNSVHLRWER